MRAQAAAAGRSAAMLDQVIARRGAVHARVMVEALGVDASMVTAML
jgi:MoxR-like ATPase